MIVMRFWIRVILRSPWGEIPHYPLAEDAPKLEHGRLIGWHTSGFK